jgi:putative transposase
MLKTFEYRLYPNRHQRELFMRCLIESRHLYNEMLARVRDHYAETGVFLFKYSLTALFKGRGGEYVPASTVQPLADRLDKALRRFIARRDTGHTVGFPRFKGANRWHSIRLRQYGKGHDVYLTANRLKVPKKLGKSIKIKQHRPLEGSPKTACLKLRADGKWYVLITCELQDLPFVPRDKPAVGLDVGLKHFLADSQRNVVSNPRHLRKSQKKLRRAQASETQKRLAPP